MISLFSLFLALHAFSIPKEFTATYELLETHEFYQENELIKKPLDAWQTIASFSVVGVDLSLAKLCLKYRPGTGATGRFTVEKMELHGNCNELGEMIFEEDSLYGIQFQKKPEFRVLFSYINFSTSEWIIKPQKKESKLKLLDTPQSIWSEGVLFLSEDVNPLPFIKDGERCLEVLDDCTVKGTSLCHQCENGAIEAPNGCETGPRYCSSQVCGSKGQPACRRGVKFLKQRVLDCRRDSTFAFCRGDATPVCQGQEVWCH